MAAQTRSASTTAPRLLAQLFVDWCATRGIGIHYSQRDKPDQNAYIERFIRTCQEEVLDAYLFESLGGVRAVSERWLLRTTMGRCRLST